MNQPQIDAGPAVRAAPAAAAPTQAAPRSVQRVRHPLKMRLLEVLRTERLSPHFVNVVLGGPDLHGFVSASFDDHVKLMLPAAGHSDVVLPALGPAGPEWAGDARPIMRDYTPRKYDAEAGELHVEIALHGAGPAAAWGESVVAGCRVGVGGPKGSCIIAPDFDWHLLIGDDSALPAIARRLEELPASSTVIAVVQVNDAADRRVFQTRAGLSVHWTAASEWLSTVRALELPDGEGFAWAVGESNAIRSMRRMLIEELGLDQTHVRAAAYWKHGTAAHHENFAG
jgi:NADPH-dependent ferric siderophore reductase